MLLKKSILNLSPIALVGVIALSPAYCAAESQKLNVIGPIEQLNCAAKTLRVLGVSFRVDEASLLTTFCSSRSPSPYKYVAVTAAVTASGSLSASRISLVVGVDYVPGATSVYLKGAVTSQKLRAGEFGITGSRVIGLPASVPNVGSEVEVIGTQPLLGGPVVATGLVIASQDVGAGGVLDGIVGSGVVTEGIVGSGLVTSGIVGSGVTASGIVGSGVVASGIVGSGVATSGIVGSGVVASGIVGSGVATSGIVGSGVVANGIVGSDVAKSGIVGSGVTANGIVGSGVAANGIVGSGVATSGIVGSGVSANGIVGSGVAVRGIVGSGAARNGIVGSG